MDDKPARREVGFAALELLSTSRLSGKAETLIIAEAWKRPLGDSKAISRLAEKVSASKNDLQNGLSPEERVFIRAARLRLSTDKKQRVESPIWTQESQCGLFDPRVGRGKESRVVTMGHSIRELDALAYRLARP